MWISNVCPKRFSQVKRHENAQDSKRRQRQKCHLVNKKSRLVSDFSRPNLPKDWGWVFLKLYKALNMLVVDQEPDGENRFVAALTTTLGSLLLLWERLEVQRELRRTVCPTLHKNENAPLGVFSVKTIACVHYWEVPCEFWWKKLIFTPIFSHLFWIWRQLS